MCPPYRTFHQAAVIYHRGTHGGNAGYLGARPACVRPVSVPGRAVPWRGLAWCCPCASAWCSTQRAWHVWHPTPLLHRRAGPPLRGDSWREPFTCCPLMFVTPGHSEGRAKCETVSYYGRSSFLRIHSGGRGSPPRGLAGS